MENSIKKIKIFKSNTKFKFGDGKQVTASKIVTLPVYIAGKHCEIHVEIVKENIPLLLSKTSLKKCNTILDMNNDKAMIFGKEVDLHFSTSGHYCINIIPEFHVCKPCNKMILMLEHNISDKQNFKQITKNHKQFSQTSKENIKKLLTNATLISNDLKQITDKAIESCETCQKFRKTPSKPVVAFTKSDSFNETLSPDLHELKPNPWYLHVVDEFSRFSAASLIANRSLVAKSFLKNWVGIFGALKKVFTDNGGEFDSSIFHELCEKFKIPTTPLYSPWSNGVCERQNQTLTLMLLKIKDSEKCDNDTPLAWAVSPKII